MSEKKQRETLASRLGFILLSAGCAIGLGNVWRFPYITGKYGGAAFVVMYLIFLVIFGLPIMVMEFSVGRASKRSVAGSFQALEPAGTKWHWYSYFAIAGNYLLMMFYTTVAGWMMAYFYFTLTGELQGLSTAEVGDFFNKTLANPAEMLYWMIITVAIGFTICSFGLREGVEKATKFMMSGLFIIMLILVFRSVTLPGAGEGLKFYLMPDFKNMVGNGFGEAVYAAMGQAFFTLSLGIGAMAIFGSYIGRDRSLTGETLNILGLDTAVALLAGLIIFPACAAFGVDAGAGPGLIFVTLPNVFNSMIGGRLWGSLFFIFMTFAAMTTVVAVFENITAYSMESFKLSRKKAVKINVLLVTLLSIPCALGFSVFSKFAPLGAGSTVLDLEDFLVSNTLLPLGCSIVMEKKARQYILDNITSAIYNKTRIVKEINAYPSIPTISQFLENNNQDIRVLYQGTNCWSSLKRAAGRIHYEDDAVTKHLEKGMSNLLHHNTASFLRFVERFIKGEDISSEPNCNKYSLILYYDLFQDRISKAGFKSLGEALALIHEKQYSCFKQEIGEIISYLLANLNIKTTPIGDDIIPGLELYGCYTREEIFTLAGRQTADRKMQGTASGVFNLPEHNATILFVTLNKSEKDFSPSTQYNDYLINEEYFHWQSQNTDSHTNNGGRRYTEQSRTKNKIILFVREEKKDGFGNTSPFHCFGLVDYVSSHDDYPMNVTWRLRKPAMAQYLKAI